MKNIQQRVKSYLEERGWDHLHPSDIAKSISIEAAELLELFQWSNSTLEEVKKDPELLKELKKELADVMIYVFEMTALLDIDTEQIVLEKIKKAEEKYPAELMKKRNGKEPGVDDIYLKIKKEYRRKGLS